MLGIIENAGGDIEKAAEAERRIIEELRQMGNEAPGGIGEGIRADFQKKYSYFPAITKPVIAAINGPPVSLGLVIALYCDLRLASDASPL
jgi:enoyl-CoA hydratase/carnithine racemase